ncbi:MAG: hypothetical protein ACE5NN_04645 [Candidatus Bathyarchaeia archaeon]
MSTSIVVGKLKEECKRIEEELRCLRDQKKKVDERLSSILQEENRFLEELRKCRDSYQYGRIDLRLNMISRSKKEMESEKEEIERKIRGYEEELIRIQRRIEYLTPK